MATRLSADRQLTLLAARRYDAGDHSDLEADMAEPFASETAIEAPPNVVRIHGPHGTHEIQRNVIARQLIKRGGAWHR